MTDKKNIKLNTSDVKATNSVKVEKKKEEMKQEFNKTTKSDILKIDPRNIVVIEGFNSRVDFDLEPLCESIKENGILNPLTVIRFKDENGNEKYRLVDGERRYRASMKLISDGYEIPRVPAITTPKLQEDELLVQQVVRNDGKLFNEAEFAIVCQKFIQFGYSTAEIAKKIGKNEGQIIYFLQHLERDERVQELIMNGKISGAEVRRIYAAHKNDESAAVDEILFGKKNAEKKGKKNITLADLDINSRAVSKKASDIIRRGLDKLFQFYTKYSVDDKGNEREISLDLGDILNKLKGDMTIDEIFQQAIEEQEKYKDVI